MNALNPFWSVTLFWIAAAVCVLLALAFVLPPLLRRREAAAKAARRDINIAVYRDQMKEMEADHANGLLSEEQFQTAKLELEARLAEDALAQADKTMTPVASRRLGYGLAGLLPVAAFGLYFVLGNPTSLTAIAEAQASGDQQVEGGHDIMKLIQQVEEKTKANPNDGEAWTILAKTYAAVGHWPEALHAYEKAIKLRPDVPSVMTGYAEALAINNNRVLEGKPIELVLKALEKDPQDIKGLELAGIAAFQEKGFAKAAFYFKHLYKQLPPESPYAQDILEAQKEAERLSKQGMTRMDNLSDADAGKGKEKAAPAPTIQGKVDIAPALKGKLGANDTIFLFARSAEGGAPAAALRAPASVGLPLEFELNDAMAMSHDNRLSKFKEVTLVARIAKTGDPKGAAGDLEGELKAVKVGAKDVRLVIDKVKP
ncbi:MAG: cycHH [bacterium]|nr:MAG: cycHH [bacterium]KAF0149490.1 MAG: cycHH [bacterium]KAF0168716.1 MAG: cycHH [bacterium]TXT23090.1 MAG: cycHH [bacterium]